jgi:hypothetical protein
MISPEELTADLRRISADPDKSPTNESSSGVHTVHKVHVVSQVALQFEKAPFAFEHLFAASAQRDLRELQPWNSLYPQIQSVAAASSFGMTSALRYGAS